MTSVSAGDLSSLAAAVVAANDQLLGFLDLASAAASTLDEDEVVAVILEHAADILRAEAVALIADGRAHFVGPATVGRELSRVEPCLADPFDVAIAIDREAFQLDAELRMARKGQPTTTGDHKILMGVLRIAVSAIRRCRLHQVAVTQAVMAHENVTAAKMAQQLLPAWRPQLQSVKFFARSDSARAAGGDFYTFACSNDRLQMAVGDVAGKGLAAAVLAAAVVTAARAAFEQQREAGPAAQLAQINDWTYDYLDASEKFVTLMVVDYDARSGVLRVANAGHSPAFVVLDGIVQQLRAECPPLGTLSSVEVAGSTYRLDQGDFLVVASDGLVEQRNVDGEQYGESRFVDLFSAPSVGSLGEFVFEAVGLFAQGCSNDDDQTLVVLQRSGDRSNE